VEGACAALQLPVPIVYRARPDGAHGRQLGVEVLSTQPPSLVISSSLLERAAVDPAEAQVLAFLVARAVTLILPQHALAGTRSPAELHQLLNVALHLARPRDEVHPEVQALVDRLEPLVPGGELASLEEAADRLAARRTELDMVELANTVQLRALRAGLLLSGSIEAAVTAARRHPESLRTLPTHTAVRGIVLFSIAEEYFSLRRKLGLGLPA
jgi:hypothetical protein